MAFMVRMISNVTCAVLVILSKKATHLLKELEIYLMFLVFSYLDCHNCQFKDIIKQLGGTIIERDQITFDSVHFNKRPDHCTFERRWCNRWNQWILMN